MPPASQPAPSSQAMQKAIGLLRSGKTVEAEEIMLRAARVAHDRHGAGSYDDAVAQNELGSILLNVRQFDRAIEAFREAVSGAEPVGEQQLRDRLTFLMNLGQTLQMAGKFQEAEEVLHKGLEGRASFYGREHAGYAFGLEPLAEVTLACGKADVALEMIEEVVGNFWRNGHTRVAGAIAIRAEIMKSAGKPGDSFAGLAKLPPKIIEDVGKQALARVARAGDLKISRQVLADLAALLSARLGDDHPQTTNVWVTITNVERKLGKDGDAAIRQAAIERLIGIFDAQGRAPDALQSVLALALAQSDSGDLEKSAGTYRQALARVDALGDQREKSQVLRNYGLLLADLKRDADAERQLAEAVSAAELSGDAEMTARALIALGIFLQHGGRLDEGRRLLERALPMLDPAHPDAIACRSHLQAIVSGQSCGCGDTSGAIAEAFREFVLARLPAGLLTKLDVTLENNDFSLGVHLSREASEEELQHLNRVVQHALEEFRRKLGRGE